MRSVGDFGRSRPQAQRAWKRRQSQKAAIHCAHSHRADLGCFKLPQAVTARSPFGQAYAENI
eukprot:2694816-Alexandrium_andersonii.AAC.1